MLTAAAHGKLKRRIEFQEDEITSCVFGTMQYLPALVVWNFTKRIAEEAGINGRAFVGNPDFAHFEFWPRWPTASNFVEPDLVIHFKERNSFLLRIIVEVKWEGFLSPPCELVRQWRHRNQLDSVPWIHLYLVKHLSSGTIERDRSLTIHENNCPEDCRLCKDREMKNEFFMGKRVDFDSWKDRLGCVGWRHFVDIAKDNAQQCGKWAEGIQSFFSKQGVVPFIGFNWLSDQDRILSEIDLEPFFRPEQWFVFLKEMDLKCTRDEMYFFTE